MWAKGIANGPNVRLLVASWAGVTHCCDGTCPDSRPPERQAKNLPAKSISLLPTPGFATILVLDEVGGIMVVTDGYDR
jgi:hypothetical protein